MWQRPLLTEQMKAVGQNFYLCSGIGAFDLNPFHEIGSGRLSIMAGKFHAQSRLRVLGHAFKQSSQLEEIVFFSG